MFRYKWNPKASEIFCNNIVRGAVAVRELQQKMPAGDLTLQQAASFLHHAELMIQYLDMIIFSASSLAFREERTLIAFVKRVEKSCGWLSRRVAADTRVLNRDVKKLGMLSDALKRKRNKLERKIKKDNEALEQDSRRSEAYNELLNTTVDHIEDVAEAIHELNSAGKAQKREVLSPHYLKEKISMRTNIGLVTLIKRDAIEIDQALKGITAKVKELRKVIARKGDVDSAAEKKLFELVVIERKDIAEIFEDSLTVKSRLEKQLHHFYQLVGKHPRLQGRYLRVKKQLDALRDEIRTQQKRMSNEFQSIDIKKRTVDKQLEHGFHKRRAT